ncbi:MAG: branched-chain amino acid ABC transporter permease [Geminicoccaceae bacterium]|nr:branched-chain amino acid ABC transporter permease [Geminicoccaceae bacterium]
MSSYLASLAVTTGIYAMLALGLNLAWGLTGMVNLGLAGFFALGAYASAIATTSGGLPVPVGMVLGFVFAGAFGLLLAAVTLRLRGDYLAIITLGFAETVRLVATNETWLTRGADGISNIPMPGRGLLTPMEFNIGFAILALIVMLVTVLFLRRLALSPMGRALRAIRDDDTIAAVAGKPIRRLRLQAFTLSAALLGFAGALFGHYNSYIAPDVFRPLITIYIFLALTVGGPGNMIGAVLGSIVVVAVLEGSRLLGDLLPDLSGTQVAALREITVGMLLIVSMRVRPRGLLPERPLRSADVGLSNRGTTP